MVSQWRSKQDWAIGKVVKVGFLNLRIVACTAVKDGMPDIYSMESVDGLKKYQFIPHHGLERVNE
jgi:hypothetical protein